MFRRLREARRWFNPLRMSGFAVLVDWDNPRPNAGDVRAMLDAMPHRGPDGMTVRATEHCVLGHALMSVHPRDRAVSLPYYDSLRRWWITGDIRIDNREDVARALGIQVPASDALLVLEAYEKWGDDCPDKLYGDFAFVIWDERERRLYAARDALGNRALFYCGLRSSVWVATEMDALVASGGIRAELDENRIADFVLEQTVEGDRTFFRGMRRLEPGCWLIAGERLVTARRYFHYPGLAPANGTHVDDASAFRTALAASVTRCADTESGLLSELSGGLDSGAIAVLLKRAPRRPDAGGVTLVASVFPGMECDESPYVEALAAEAQIPLNRHDLAGRPAVPPDRWPLADPARSWAPSFHGWQNDRLGARVLLSGSGGDELTVELASLRDMARHGDLLGLVRFAMHRYAYTGAAPVTLAWRAVRSEVRAAVPLRRVRFTSAPAWLGPACCRRFGLTPQLPPTPAEVAHVHAATWRAFMAPANVCLRERREQQAARVGLELRRPFVDRGLLEQVLRIPWRRRRLVTPAKALLRSAVSRELPPVVAARRNKTAFSGYRAWYARQLADWARACVLEGLGELAPYVAESYSRSLALSATEPARMSQEGCHRLYQLALSARWLCGWKPTASMGRGR
jgi:asparagine synthase (glutamine-hydrolysing)